jgi:hypothetical protein
MNTICHLQSNILQCKRIESRTPIPDLFWYKLNNNVYNYKVSNLPIVDASYGGVPSFVVSRLPGELCFSASGGTGTNFVYLPSVTRIPTMTFSCWINCTSFTTFSRIFDYGSFRLAFRGAQRLQLNDTYNLNFATTLVGSWKHICFTVNNTTFTHYENGILKATIVMTPLNSTSVGFIAKSTANDPGAVCRFSDLRLYGRVLSASEISTLFQN